jgi:hypothetical protein
MRSVLVTATTVLAVIGIGIGALAASGQAGVRPAPPAKSAGICGAIASIRGVTVRRGAVLAGDHATFSFPPVIAISSPARAERAARLFCSLSPVPPGTALLCPIDFGVSYGFEFVTRTAPVDVLVEGSGCLTVGGAPSTPGALSPRWIGGSSFWRSLGATIGLRDASHATFEGTIVGTSP